jgi:hypothetical protein
MLRGARKLGFKFTLTMAGTSDQNPKLIAALTRTPGRPDPATHSPTEFGKYLQPRNSLRFNANFSSLLKSLCAVPG